VRRGGGGGGIGRARQAEVADVERERESWAPGQPWPCGEEGHGRFLLRFASTAPGTQPHTSDLHRGKSEAASPSAGYVR
jgi:hypothetical protein